MCNGQAQTCALNALGAFQSGKGLEYLLSLLCSHAFSCVFYAQDELECIRIFHDVVSVSGLGDRGLDVDASSVGIFDGIADEIVQYLADAERISLV